MKKFDLKSFAAGLLIGTLGITTAFAATGIQSAELCDTKVTLKSESNKKCNRVEFAGF